MNKRLKGCVVEPSKETETWLRALGVEVVHHIKQADFVVFPGTGASDVDPYFYGQYKHTETHATEPDRDHTLLALAQTCDDLGLPMIGICRGAQLLFVYQGGSLIQHVNGHTAGSHMTTFCPSLGLSPSLHTSSHHQVIDSNSLLGTEVLGTCEDDGYPEVFTVENTILGFQSHPEWLPVTPESKREFWALFSYVFPHVVGDTMNESVGGV